MPWWIHVVRYTAVENTFRWITWNNVTYPWHIFIWNLCSKRDPGVFRNHLIPFIDIAHNDLSTQVQRRPTHIYVLMKMKFYHQITTPNGTIPDSKNHGSIWGPSGADRTQVGSMLAPWTLLSGIIKMQIECNGMSNITNWYMWWNTHG